MYSRLKSISVSNGQTVKAKTTIGQVATNADGVAEVHFQTWKGLQIMDPATWLAPNRLKILTFIKKIHILLYSLWVSA
jgi:murein DD-endopeptidase MepM/ murein hydrolase activator NlpD